MLKEKMELENVHEFGLIACFVFIPKKKTACYIKERKKERGK